MTFAIEAEGLVKRFGKTLAVDGVDLAVRPGMVLGLLGPNGAGKTTVVRMLATLLRPDAGQARVCGADIVGQPGRVLELIGLTGQYAAVDEDLTGFENLLLIGRLLEIPGMQAKRRSGELLERFGLADAAGRSVKTYSGGMRRRLDLAASLVRRPQVLFLDEPTTGLDPRSRGEIPRQRRHPAAGRRVRAGAVHGVPVPGPGHRGAGRAGGGTARGAGACPCRGHAVPDLDGKVVATGRCREKTLSRKGETVELRYAGKTDDFGGNIQALFYPSGIPMWVSDVLPGNVHDLAAARENVLAVLRPFLDAMPALADPGYEGAGRGIHVPVKKPAGVKELDINTRARNALLRSARCLGERGFALLTQRWRTLQHVTASPGKIGLIAQAALVLVLFEHKMLT